MDPRLHNAIRRTVAVFVALYGVLLLAATSNSQSSAVLFWQGVALLLLSPLYWQGKRLAFLGVATVALVVAYNCLHAFMVVYGVDDWFPKAQFLGTAIVMAAIAVGSIVQCVRRRISRARAVPE